MDDLKLDRNLAKNSKMDLEIDLERHMKNFVESPNIPGKSLGQTWMKLVVNSLVSSKIGLKLNLEMKSQSFGRNYEVT